MFIEHIKNLFFDCKLDICDGDYETIYQGNCNKIPRYLDEYEIIDITTNAGYILIRVAK